ncbi:MAG TPA: sigma-54 dependent transcriptional regulator [Pirellulales bacterium]|jgi:two-component system nitrogen regulation response regulator GlnG|nr:sigma-54 dependent transcriptional regulator [Pirellulales bacterium]
MPRLLVIDDDRSVLRLIERGFEKTDVAVLTALTAEEGLAHLRQHTPDVLLLDVMLPGTNWLDVFRQIQEIDRKLPVIYITAHGNSDTAIEAMSNGAYDYLMKPLDLPTVRQLVHRALEMRRLMRVPVDVPLPPTAGQAGDSLVGRSPKMQEVYKAIGRVASQDVIVLIRGESGTGKELVARAIYQHSPRAGGPFLAVNCAAIPESLLESELFGHERGSFTGADSRRIGKFEQCSGGTIFLDEVGDMSALIQSKVLRVLQEQRFERVGGNTTLETDVRIIAATNCNLEQMVADGQFRGDLYYRLNGFTIQLPALRERGDDLLLLLEHFLHRFRHELGKEVQAISPDALHQLMQYSWPGNIRELQSVLRQSLLQAAGPVIIPDFLPEVIHREPAMPRVFNGSDESSSNLQPLVESRLRAGSTNLYAETVELMERYLIMQVLRSTGGNQSHAAIILGITRGCLRRKIRTLKIGIRTSIASHGADAEENEEATISA